MCFRFISVRAFDVNTINLNWTKYYEYPLLSPRPDTITSYPLATISLCSIYLHISILSYPNTTHFINIHSLNKTLSKVTHSISLKYSLPLHPLYLSPIHPCIIFPSPSISLSHYIISPYISLLQYISPSIYLSH